VAKEAATEKEGESMANGGNHVHVTANGHCEEAKAAENGMTNGHTHGHPHERAVVEMTIDEIINGKQPDFPGLVPLMMQYLDSADVDVETRCTIQRYLAFIRARASGKISTTARWMRDYVRDHPAYKHDSIVSDEITYDLLKKMDAISKGAIHCERLLGKFRVSQKDVASSAPCPDQDNQQKLNGVNGIDSINHHQQMNGMTNGIDESIAKMI
jgi:hypothetical protein